MLREGLDFLLNCTNLRELSGLRPEPRWGARIAQTPRFGGRRLRRRSHCLRQWLDAGSLGPPRRGPGAPHTTSQMELLGALAPRPRQVKALCLAQYEAVRAEVILKCYQLVAVPDAL